MYSCESVYKLTSLKVTWNTQCLSYLMYRYSLNSVNEIQFRRLSSTKFNFVSFPSLVFVSDVIWKVYLYKLGSDWLSVASKAKTWLPLQTALTETHCSVPRCHNDIDARYQQKTAESSQVILYQFPSDKELRR